jgi:hypothetical protein
MKIASLMIHVERHIKRVKEYKLFQSTVPLTIVGSVDQLWTIANILTLVALNTYIILEKPYTLIHNQNLQLLKALYSEITCIP